MKRTERIGLVLTPAEKGAAHRIATSNSESVAVVLRRLIRQEAKRRGLWDSTPTKEVQNVR